MAYPSLALHERYGSARLVQIASEIVRTACNVLRRNHDDAVLSEQNFVHAVDEVDRHRDLVALLEDRRLERLVRVDLVVPSGVVRSARKQNVATKVIPKRVVLCDADLVRSDDAHDEISFTAGRFVHTKRALVFAYSRSGAGRVGDR